MQTTAAMASDQTVTCFELWLSLIRVREDMVHRIANNRGVSQPADTQGGLTVQQYLDWYKKEPLSNDDFEWALQTCKALRANRRANLVYSCVGAMVET